MKTSAIRAIRFLAIATLLVLVTRKSTAEKALRAKYREWVEEGDRIHVRSWYAEAETALTEEWSLDVVGIVDTWSGATPVGWPPTDPEWLSDPIEETREEGPLFRVCLFFLSSPPDADPALTLAPASSQP